MIPNYSSRSELVTKLLQLPKFGNGIGFQRMDSFLRREPIASWISQIDAIKITGSNGKGSTCNMVAAILQQAGFQVGLYTSPHIFRFNERICINGVDISDRDLQIAAEWTFEAIEEYQKRYPHDNFGAFEVFTSIALYHFATKQVDALVIEAGIGGRYDSTRAIAGNIAAITSVELEHTEILGSSLEAIAYDKADLCPSGGLLVIGDINPEILRRLKSYCAIRKVTPIAIGDSCTFSDQSYFDEIMSFNFQCRDIDWGELQLKPIGSCQMSNAAVAIILAEHWLRIHKDNFIYSEFQSTVRYALAKVSVLGRLQKVSTLPEIYVDVAHTPNAMDYLAQSIEKLWQDEPILLVTGVSYNKDIEGILKKIAKLPTQAICTRARHRGGSVDVVADYLASLRPDLPISRVETLEKAVEMAVDIGKIQKMKILVAGGLFLVAEAMYILQGKEPDSLQLF